MTSTLDAPQRLSQVEAVNLVLNAYGITSVASIDANPQAASATEHLIRALQFLCKKGYKFSTTNLEQLTPDVNGEIAIGATVLEVVPCNKDQGRHLVRQGAKLFDRDESTYVFDDEYVYANVTRTVPFDDLPQEASWYCAVAAAVSYLNENKSGDPAIHQFEKARLLALVDLEQADSRQQGDLISTNEHFYRHRGRARSHRSSV